MELLGFFSLTSFAALPIIFVVPAVFYILESVALMRIGQKVGLKACWRSFLPLINCFFMGKIAEKDTKIYHPEKKGKKWGALTLWLEILLMLFTLVSMGLFGLLVAFTGMSGTQGDTPATVAGSFGLVLLGVLAYIVFFAMLLVICIVMWIVLYKIYHVMAGGNAVWMLILSIFFGLATPIILLVLAFSSKFPRYAAKSKDVVAVISQRQSAPAVEASTLEEESEESCQEQGEDRIEKGAEDDGEAIVIEDALEKAN
ncbi:MAG: hypothetical protein J6M12_03170 [Clostridia bacterium]|nr:hypothetical protein [Clostridia bacterium]